MEDKIVKNIVEQFQQRSEVGIKKYGTTLEDNNKDDFLQHLKEEMMDGILYIEKEQSMKSKVNKILKDRLNHLKSSKQEYSNPKMGRKGQDPFILQDFNGRIDEVEWILKQFNNETT